MAAIINSLVTIRDTFNHHVIFSVGIILIAGYLLGKIVAKFRFPEITGYIIAGLLLGDSGTHVIHIQMSESLKAVTEVALGLIALTIGGEFYLVKLRRLGKGIIIITLAQLFFTFLCVALGLFYFNLALPYALLLGAIASATAPAATVAIAQSLRARGVFIDYLYGIVALDDAGCVILFGVIFALVSGLLSQAGMELSRAAIIFQAVLEVVFSLLIGIVSGFLLHLTTNRRENTNEILIISLGIIFATIAVAISLHISPLITNMAAGCVLINLSARNHRIFRILEPLTPPIYAMFFVLAGTELQPGIFLHTEVLLLGTMYIMLRAIGKYGGVYLGCLAGKVPDPIRKYLGFCMLPQAGVAIGLVLFIQASPVTAGLAPAEKRIFLNMVNIVLLSVFVNELIGPLISRYAIIKGNGMEA